MSAALFCLSNLAILWIAAVWAARLSQRGADFTLGVIALFPISAVLTVLGAGLVGQLGIGGITLALLVIAVLCGPQFASVKRALSGFSVPHRPAARWATVIFAVYLSLPLARAVKAGTGYFIDDFGYHTVAVASWVQTGDFRQCMPQFMAYLPLNAELLSCWFALPFHHDGMVVLGGVAWLALAAAAAAGLVRRGGGSVAVSVFVATLVIGSPVIAWQVRTFSAGDLAGSASLLAAVYFSAQGRSDRRLGRAVVAGLLAGFAAGTKATFLPVSAVICFYPLFSGPSRRERWREFAVVTLMTVLLGTVWYWRNALVTGNPLFPAELGPFAGPLHKAHQDKLKLTGLIAQVPWTFRLWGDMIYRYLDWSLPLGVIALAGYGRALLCECRRSVSGATGDRGLQRLLLIGGSLQFFLHWFAPFCLGGGSVDGRIEVYSRYIMPWFLFGLVLAAPLFASRARIVFFGIASLGLLESGLRNGLLSLGGLAVFLVACALLRFVPHPKWKPLIIAGAVAVWPLLAALAPRMHEAAGQNLRRHSTTTGKPMGEAYFALETLPAGTRIARFTNHYYLNSPLFGRHWQFAPVFTDAVGNALPLLHVEFRANPKLPFVHVAPDWPIMPSAQELISNLRAARIGAVLVSKFDTDAWPPQRAMLASSADATMIFSDESTAVFVIR